MQDALNRMLADSFGPHDRAMTHQALGAMLELCARHPDRSAVDLQSFVHWLKPAVLHSQYLFLQEKGDVEPRGYLTWAWVDRDTLERYRTVPRFTLHPSEWHEGAHLIVVDFCVLGPATPFLSRLLTRKDDLLWNGARSVSICIRNRAGMPVQYRTWE